MKRMTWFGIGAAVLVAGGGIAWYASRNNDEVKFRYAKVDRGAIRQRVSATGQLSAVVQVSVGTQVSGMITMINADFNSIVKAGQVIAQVDSTPWEQGVKDAEAALMRTQANFEDAKRQLERTRRLFKEKLVAEQELDAKQTTFDTARAQLESSRISLEKAKVNLGYCTIKAPVDGVVVSRLADVGQTVAASFSTPNLFTIAQDLSKMKLEVNVDEADIAQLKVGQTASFTVDSIPDTQFRGRVSQVRLEPVVQQNVVNYKVVVEVDNQTQEEIAARKAQREAMMDAMQGGPGGAKAPEAAAKPAAKPEAKPTPKAPAAKPAEAPRSEGGEDRPRGEGRGMGMMGGSFDPDTMWDRVKDRVQERNPGMTKEQWVKQMKERMAQWGQGGGRRPEGERKATATAPASGASRVPGGIIKAGGPFYGGEFVLRPGMTANVTIVTNEKQDVLRVPNAALRFNPMNFLPEEKGGAPAQASAAAARPGNATPTQDRRARMMDRGFMARREDRVWIMENKKPKAIVVKAGLTDGQFTEVTCDQLQPGAEIMVGVEEAKKSNAAAMPGMPGMGGMGGRR